MYYTDIDINTLYQIRNLTNIFNGKSYIIKCLILFKSEAEIIIKYLHETLFHLGEKMLQYEIIRWVLYVNNIITIIKNIVKNCKLFIVHKLNEYIKHANIQIISKKPFEHLQIDILFQK